MNTRSEFISILSKLISKFNSQEKNNFAYQNIMTSNTSEILSRRMDIAKDNFSSLMESITDLKSHINQLEEIKIELFNMISAASITAGKERLANELAEKYDIPRPGPDILSDKQTEILNSERQEKIAEVINEKLKTLATQIDSLGVNSKPFPPHRSKNDNKSNYVVNNMTSPVPELNSNLHQVNANSFNLKSDSLNSKSDFSAEQIREKIEKLLMEDNLTKHMDVKNKSSEGNDYTDRNVNDASKRLVSGHQNLPSSPYTIRGADIPNVASFSNDPPAISHNSNRQAIPYQSSLKELGLDLSNISSEDDALIKALIDANNKLSDSNNLDTNLSGFEPSFLSPSPSNLLNQTDGETGGEFKKIASTTTGVTGSNSGVSRIGGTFSSNQGGANTPATGMPFMPPMPGVGAQHQNNKSDRGNLLENSDKVIGRDTTQTRSATADEEHIFEKDVENDR